MHLSFLAYAAMAQQSPYGIHNLSSVTTASSYGCPIDRWSLLTPPGSYDVTSSMTNSFHGRLPSYMTTMPYSYPLSPPLTPGCTMTMPPCGQPLPDAAMLTGMPLRAMSNVSMGQATGLTAPATSQSVDISAASQAMASLSDLTSMAECKRLDSLNTLRLKAKDHTTVVQYQHV